MRSITAGKSSKYSTQILERIWKIVTAYFDRAIISNLEHEKSINDEAHKKFLRYQNKMEKEYLVL